MNLPILKTLYIDDVETKITSPIGLEDFSIFSQFCKFYGDMKKYDFEVRVEQNDIYLTYNENIRPGRYVYDVYIENDATLEKIKLFYGDVIFTTKITDVPFREILPA